MQVILELPRQGDKLSFFFRCYEAGLGLANWVGRAVANAMAQPTSTIPRMSNGPSISPKNQTPLRDATAGWVSNASPMTSDEKWRMA